MCTFFYHHFTFHGDIGYFDFIVSQYGNYTCGVISLFELNLISKVQHGNEIAALYTALYIQCGSYLWFTVSFFLTEPNNESSSDGSVE